MTSLTNEDHIRKAILRLYELMGTSTSYMTVVVLDELLTKRTAIIEIIIVRGELVVVSRR